MNKILSCAACLAVAATLTAGCSSTKEATKDAASSAAGAGSSAASVASSAATSAAEAGAAAATGMTTLYYPAQEGAMFSIEAPADWTVGKIDQVGDFGSVESANGSVLQFRAQKFDSDAQVNQEIDAIADSTTGFLKDNYTDIELGKPEDVTIEGKPGVQLAGTGKDKAGNAVKFLSAMIILGPNSLAEIWAAVFPEGNNDLDTAGKILDSFKPAATP